MKTTASPRSRVAKAPSAQTTSSPGAATGPRGCRERGRHSPRSHWSRGSAGHSDRARFYVASSPLSRQLSIEKRSFIGVGKVFDLVRCDEASVTTGESHPSWRTLARRMSESLDPNPARPTTALFRMPRLPHHHPDNRGAGTLQRCRPPARDCRRWKHPLGASPALNKILRC